MDPYNEYAKYIITGKQLRRLRDEVDVKKIILTIESNQFLSQTTKRIKTILKNIEKSTAKVWY